MHSDSTAIDSSGVTLPIHFDTAVASGVFLRLDIDQDLDCDLKPNPEDFSISLPLCEANANSTVRPIALQLKPMGTEEQPCTSIILVLDEALPPVSEMELHYHPQEAMMWSNTLDDSIAAFITHIPVKLSRHEPKEAFSTKLLETIAQKSKKPDGPAPEAPAITELEGDQITIALNRLLIPHQGVAVGDFRAEAQDRWCTVSAAAVRQSSSDEPHEIHLALKEALNPGDTVTVAFKAKRYPITSLDGSQINNFKVSARYQGPGEFEILSTEENEQAEVAATSNASEQTHLQALESILDQNTGALATPTNSKESGQKSRKLFNGKKKAPSDGPKMTWLQKFFLLIFIVFVGYLAVATVKLFTGLSGDNTARSAPEAVAPVAATPTNPAPVRAVDTSAEPCNLTFDSGNLYDGTCNAASKPHGSGNFQWMSGSSYEGNFINGQRSGPGSMTYANGAKYQGSWLNDKKHGQGTYWSENGNRFEGRFEQGKMTSEGTCFLSDGSEISGFCPN